MTIILVLGVGSQVTECVSNGPIYGGKRGEWFVLRVFIAPVDLRVR